MKKVTFRDFIVACSIAAAAAVVPNIAGATNNVRTAPALGNITGSGMSSGAAVMGLGALNNPGTPKTYATFIAGGMETISGVKLTTSPNPEIKSYTATIGGGVTSDPNNNGLQIAQSNDIAGQIVQAPVGQPGHPGQPGGGH